MSLASDDQTLVSASPIDGEVKHWDIATVRLLHSFTIPKKYVPSLVYSRDGRPLAASYGKIWPDGQGRIRLWDVTTGRECGRLPCPKNSIMCSKLSSDGTTLAFASSDATVRLWNIAMEEETK